MSPRPIDALTKFQSKHIPVTETGCWLWTSSLSHNGYGQFGSKGKCIRAHRFSWELKNGPIPKGMCVCHKCDTRSCVNPDHLFIGTIKENIADKVRKNRQARGESLAIAQGNRLKVGERTNSVVLTKNQVIAIRNESGSHAKIAKKYGVSSSAIFNVISRKTWKHV